MKFTKSLFLIAVTGMLFTSCKQSENEAVVDDSTVKSEAIAGKIETASFSVDGMSCSVGCAKTIEKKLAKMDGVQEATVDYDKKTATVKFDNGKLTAEKLVEAVESAADGKTYKVSNVKSSGDSAMLSDNDKEKGKKKKKSKKGSDDKKDCSPDDKKAANGKPACCAAKKACAA